jgi:hypothetical protein
MALIGAFAGKVSLKATPLSVVPLTVEFGFANVNVSVDVPLTAMYASE